MATVAETAGTTCINCLQESSSTSRPLWLCCIMFRITCRGITWATLMMSSGELSSISCVVTNFVQMLCLLLIFSWCCSTLSFMKILFLAVSNGVPNNAVTPQSSIVLIIFCGVIALVSLGDEHPKIMTQVPLLWRNWILMKSI